MATAQRQEWAYDAPEAVDQALEKYLNVLVFNGELSNAGLLMLCGFCWVKCRSTQRHAKLPRVIGKVPDSIFAEAHTLAAYVRDLVRALQQ